MTVNFKKSTVARRAKILEELEKHGQVLVKELCDMFDISGVTIRNDLKHLEHQNMLIRARGGAIKTKVYGTVNELSIIEKQNEHRTEKLKIANAAQKLIEDGDTIVFDSGTTTTEIAKNLSRFNELTIITNALNIASILSEYEKFNVFMPGGALNKKSLSLIGVIANENYNKFYCDKLFLGADGVDTMYGLSSQNTEEAHLNQIMLKIAKKVIVVTDSSKFNRRRFAHIAPLTAIDIVVTDSGISSEDKARLENSGIRVIVV